MRGFAPAAGAVVLLTTGVLLAGSSARWQGAWAETATEVHGSLLITVPLAAAAGCWQGGRERRRRTEELWGTVVHAPLARLLASALVPIVALAPLLASAVIGTSLYSASDELDRTAVRPWWPRRLAQVLALAALASALLSPAVLGRPEVFGPPAVVRNTLGCTGVTAAAAVVLGARLSWLPAFGYVTAVYVASSGARGRAATVWAWPMQPGAQPGAWAAALAAFVLGAACYAVRGARGEGPRG